MIDTNDIMSVSYTELDNGIPALCFCSDIIIPITNKTMANSFCNYIDNDMKFNIANMVIQTLMFTFISNDVISVKAKLNGSFEQMGFVNTQDIYECMKKVVDTLKAMKDENQARD